jgi:hypothetical protein
MKFKYILLAAMFFCGMTEAATFTPTFTVDYSTCGNDPVVFDSSVTFGSGSTCYAGRVVSNQAYKNITQIQATVDLSQANNNFVNNTFYMVNNPTYPTQQPIGSNYCDAGGNNNQWNCQEIDFFEANSNKVFQSTLHLGAGGSNATQRFELSYSDTSQNNPCFNASLMTNDPHAGSHSMVGIIDVTKPFLMTVAFTYGTTPGMTITYSQNTNSVVVYDTNDGPGYSGSGVINLDYLTSSMAQGYWLELSMWQGGWSPGQPQGWWNNTCPWGALCNTQGSYFGVSDIVVTADGAVTRSLKKPEKKIQ